MRKEILPLTTIRGIAAMSVVAMHYSATLQLIANREFPSLVPHASLAVDVFFVLSGFIMGYTYLESFRSQDIWTAYRKFLGKRAARILPLNAFIVITITVVATLLLWLTGTNPIPAVRPDHAWSDLLTNLLLLPGLGIGNSVNGPAWSISVESATYFAFPVLLFLVFSQNRWIFLATCLIAAAALPGCIGLATVPDGIHNNPWPWRDFLRCVTEFTLGIAVFRVYASGKLSVLFAKDSTALAISFGIIAIILLSLPGILALWLFPPLILALSLNNGWVARLMSLRFPYFLGQISFSLYLVTDPFRWPLQQLVKAWHPAPISPALALPLAAIFSLLMIFPAWATYLLIERPGRSAIRQAIAGKTRAGLALLFSRNA